MAYERLNLIDDDVLKAEHIGHMEDGIERANSVLVSSGSPDTLTWDGDITGKEVVADMFVKTSDAAVPAEALANGGSVTVPGLSDYGAPDTVAWTGDDVDNEDEKFSVVYPSAQGDVTMPVAAFVREPALVDGTPFDVGVYFARLPAGDTWTYTSEFTINGYTGFAKEQIPPAYLPMDDIAEAVISKLPVYNGEVV
jgi:hypothetical protein